MGFLERFQKIKGIQEAAEAAAGVLNQTTTGRVGGNLGKIEPELQAPIVNPGSVADGDKNPANLVKQQLATTEKPAIAAAAKIEKEKKDGQAQAKADAQATMQNIMGAVNNPSAMPEVQTVTEGGTNVSQGGTKNDVKTDEQKKANDEALRNAGVASMQKTLTPTFATGRDKVSEFQEMMANQEQESDRLKRAEDRAERRKENLKAIYGILNGAGAALAGKKGLQTGAKEEGEKAIKNAEDQFTKRMTKAREDLKEKQARELKAYILKREDAKQKKEDEQKEREYQLRVNADNRAEKESESRIKAREDNAKYHQDKLELDYIKLKKQHETDPLKKKQLELREAELELNTRRYEDSLRPIITENETEYIYTDPYTGKEIKREKKSKTTRTREGSQGGGDSRLSTNGGSKPKRKV